MGPVVEVTEPLPFLVEIEFLDQQVEKQKAEEEVEKLHFFFVVFVLNEEHVLGLGYEKQGGK